MQHEIKKYPVKHPRLRKYIKFFWELHIDHTRLNHRIIPQRNINLRFNLSNTAQYLNLDGSDYLLEDVFFSGIQDHFMNAHMKLNGMVDMLGVCFLPDGFYPFLNIPVSEFKNQFLGAGEVGFYQAKTINEKLKESPDINSRIELLEKELLLQLEYTDHNMESFRRIFSAIKQSGNSLQILDFCRRNDIGMRKLERMFNKYVGISAMSYGTLNRFQNSLNQILFDDYSKLSDIAFGNGYFDQMHFIKEFKRYTGSTPKNFVHQNGSILQIGKFK